MTRKTAEHHLSLAADPHAPRLARTWLGEQVAGLDLTDEVEHTGLLVLSELVTNAIRHGQATVDVTLSVLADRLRIAVRDRAAELPVFDPVPGDAARTSGRGLLIVAATALDWGVRVAADDGEGPGKTVWAEIAR